MYKTKLILAAATLSVLSTMTFIANAQEEGVIYDWKERKAQRRRD